MLFRLLLFVGFFWGVSCFFVSYRMFSFVELNWKNQNQNLQNINVWWSYFHEVTCFTLEWWTFLPCFSCLNHFLQVEDFFIISAILLCRFIKKLHSWLRVPFYYQLNKYEQSVPTLKVCNQHMKIQRSLIGKGSRKHEINLVKS